MRRLFGAALLTAACFGISASAHADLIFLGATDLGGQGFGNAPRLLTIQEKDLESGAIGVLNGAIVALTPGISDSLVFSGNGITNAGGNTVNPLDGNKFGIPTLGSLNWISASQVQILFNPDEPSKGGLDVTDLTLKFYNGNTVIAAIDGAQAFASTDPGNGKSGFLFGVDLAQQTFLNNTVFNQAGAADFRIAMEATITGTGGGPDSFSAIAAAAPELSTWAMMLIGFAGLGFVAYRRTRKFSASHPA